ncbi:MAG TPA: hypothetical protein VF581_11400 [Flavobacterium sp.]|jgi:hypothetical protein
MKKYVTFSFLAILCCCKNVEEPVALFEQPQPIKIKNLGKIPKRLTGKYYNATDSSFILINSNVIIRKNHFRGKIHLNDIDSNYVLRGNILEERDTREQMQVHQIGDSLGFDKVTVDTIFRLNGYNQIRKQKGQYFLNIKSEGNLWEVRNLWLVKGILKIETINSPEELKKLQTITGTPVDTIISIPKFNPSEKQFKEYLKNNGFGDDGKAYIKIN